MDPMEYHESRVGRSLVNVHEQQDEYPKEEIISAVDKCMQKYGDNLLQHLEGISGRVSQFEHSMGQFRADIIRQQSESDSKLKSLEKCFNEVLPSNRLVSEPVPFGYGPSSLFQHPNTVTQSCSTSAPNPPKPNVNVDGVKVDEEMMEKAVFCLQEFIIEKKVREGIPRDFVLRILNEEQPVTFDTLLNGWTTLKNWII